MLFFLKKQEKAEVENWTQNKIIMTFQILLHKKTFTYKQKDFLHFYHIYKLKFAHKKISYGYIILDEYP